MTRIPRTPDSLQRQLALLKKAYDKKVDVLVAGVRLKHVVPFCDRHALQFGTWNGDWAFVQMDGQRPELNAVPNFPGSEALNALLHTQVDQLNDVGGLMAGYVGKNYERSHPMLEMRRGLSTATGRRSKAIA
jgi:hypothetical protein